MLFIYFTYLFLVVFGLRRCVQALSSRGEREPLPICGARTSHCGGLPCCRAWALGARASVVVARGLHSTGSPAVALEPSCSAACGILPDQGSNPRPLHWQADSQPLRHQGSPSYHFLCSPFLYIDPDFHLVSFFFFLKDLSFLLLFLFFLKDFNICCSVGLLVMNFSAFVCLKHHTSLFFTFKKLG